MPVLDFQRPAGRSLREMKMIADIADEISKSALFNGLPAEQVEELARICVDLKYEKGRELFSEGSEAKGFYLVISGKFKIYKLSTGGQRANSPYIRGRRGYRGSPGFCGRKLPGQRGGHRTQPGTVFSEEVFCRVDRQGARHSS